MKPKKKLRELDPKNYDSKLTPEVELIKRILMPGPEPSNKLKKIFEVYRHNEGKRMQLLEAESCCVNEIYRKEERKAAEEGPPRPKPRFEMGQSVHHFWASWMAGAKANPRQINKKKKGRPHWYSAQVYHLRYGRRFGTAA